MAWETAALMLPSILELLGVGNINQIPEKLQSKVMEMAEEAYRAWQDKLNSNNYSTASLRSGKPDFNWLRSQIYEKQAQQYYDYKKELAEAEKKDNQSFWNTSFGKVVKGTANVLWHGVKPVVDVSAGITGQYDKWAPHQAQASSNIQSLGNENKNAVNNKYAQIFAQDDSKNKIAEINKQQIDSHNSARKHLNEYKRSKFPTNTSKIHYNNYQTERNKHVQR